MGWLWHQLDHMQVIYTSLQTDNYASTSPLSFYRPDALHAAQPTASKQWWHQSSLKISCKSVQKLLHKAASRQTDKHSNKQRWLYIILGEGNNNNNRPGVVLVAKPAVSKHWRKLKALPPNSPTALNILSWSDRWRMDAAHFTPTLQKASIMAAVTWQTQCCQRLENGM